MKSPIKFLAVLAFVGGSIAGIKTETRYNGDTYCGSYENPCICDDVDPQTGHCRVGGGGG